MASDLEYEIGPGEVTRIFSEAETKEIDAAWVKAYCKDKQGANIKAYRWHIFSFEKYPAVDGEEANNLYLSKNEPEYIILPNDGECAIETNQLPTECTLMDYLVFPKNMAWTMAFTHEAGWLGPYFAKHKRYEQLNRDNTLELERRLKKQKEIELAKSKGWM